MYCTTGVFYLTIAQLKINTNTNLIAFVYTTTATCLRQFLVQYYGLYGIQYFIKTT
jgi:hypothetical protein